MKPVPSMFGRYELLEHLGGGMADVYRARDTVIGKTVAIKILKPGQASNPEVKERFLDEARTAAVLEHQHVINVFDYGEIENQPYMVMEFLRGQDLRALIAQSGSMTLAEKLQIALQAADALAFVHAQGVIHRDIKPENLHLSTSGVIRLIDFGIAKSTAASLQTQPGYALGTIYYMAPEQVKGESTKLVDIYAFGLVLYELLTGVRAVSGETHEQVFYCILQQPINLEPLQRAGIPKPLHDLICNCTAKDASKRPQSFDAVHADLQKILASLPFGATQATEAYPPTTTQKPAWWIYSAIAATVGMLLAGLVWYLIPSLQKKTAAAGKTTEIVKIPLRPVLNLPPGMLLVRGGKFLFGSAKEPRELPDFYIDKTEVTNAAYAHITGRKQPGRPDFPVVNVTAAEARGFCEADGKRLPSSLEWEKAARGEKGYEFPWGNDLDATRANVQDNLTLKVHRVMQADAFPKGASPYGALQMAGNVWEFVNDTRLPNQAEIEGLQAPKSEWSVPWPVIYGGSYKQKLADTDSNVRSWDNAVIRPLHKDGDTGFRCAKSP